MCLHLLRSLWPAACLVSAIGSVFLLAFADAPRAGRRVRWMFWPLVVGGLTCYGCGAWAIGLHGGGAVAGLLRRSS